MAFNPNPSSWISGWSVAGGTLAANTHVSFPIASVPELSVTEAQGTSSGDIRKVMFALCEKMHTAYVAAAAAGNAPNRMNLFKSASVNTTTGVVTNSYTFTFQNTVTGQEVQDEPA
jgi:hypothetical protein